MVKHLPCGCQLETDTNKFVALCEADKARVKKQAVDAVAASKVTLEERVAALEKRVWG